MKHYKFLFILSLIITHSITGFSEINEAIRFKITDPNSNTDETIIRLKDEASPAFDPMWDAWKIFTSNDMVPSLYTLTDNLEGMTINSFSAPIKDSSVFIYMRARITGGIFNLTSEQLGTFPVDIKMALKDLETNVIYELNQDINISFNVSSDSINDFPRFELFYSPKSTISISENDLTVTNQGCISWNYTLMNSLGQLLSDGLSNTQNLLLSDLANDDYSIMIEDEYGLIDTLFFSIDFLIQDSTQYLSIYNEENPLLEPIITFDGSNYYLIFGKSLRNPINVSVYNINGVLLKQTIEFEDKILLNTMDNKGIMILKIESEGKFQTLKFLKL